MLCARRRLTSLRPSKVWVGAFQLWNRVALLREPVQGKATAASATADGEEVAVAEPPPSKRPRAAAAVTDGHPHDNLSLSPSTISRVLSSSDVASGGSLAAAAAASSLPVAAAAGTLPGAATAAAAGFSPSCVAFKIGESEYIVTDLTWDYLAGVDVSELLENLLVDPILGDELQAVDHNECRVYVLKGKLPAEKSKPTAADEEPTKMLELKGFTTLGKAVKVAGCTGDRLFIRVTLPDADSTPPRSIFFSAQSLSDLPALSDTHKINQVVAAIRNGKVTEGAIGLDGKRIDNHLRLPDGMTWPAATNNVLYVRQYYAPLLEHVLEFCTATKPGELPSQMRRIVVGQSGLGKSVWVWYVVYRMLRERPHRTLIVACNDNKKAYIIPPQGGPLRVLNMRYAGLSLLAHIEGLGPEPLLIADALLPSVLPMPTLVMSTPAHLADRDLSNKLNSYSAPWYYMPIPSEEEVLDMNAVCFGGKDVEGVKLRMSLWGPIPRHVLVDTSAAEQRGFWEDAKAIKFDTLVNLGRGYELRSVRGARLANDLDPAYRIIHVRAAGQDAKPGTLAADVTHPEYYYRGKIVLASPSMLLYYAKLCVAMEKEKEEEAKKKKKKGGTKGY